MTVISWVPFVSWVVSKKFEPSAAVKKSNGATLSTVVGPTGGALSNQKLTDVVPGGPLKTMRAPSQMMVLGSETKRSGNASASTISPSYAGVVVVGASVVVGFSVVGWTVVGVAVVGVVVEGSAVVVVAAVLSVTAGSPKVVAVDEVGAVVVVELDDVVVDELAVDAGGLFDAVGGLVELATGGVSAAAVVGAAGAATSDVAASAARASNAFTASGPATAPVTVDDAARATTTRRLEDAGKQLSGTHEEPSMRGFISFFVVVGRHNGMFTVCEPSVVVHVKVNNAHAHHGTGRVGERLGIELAIDRIEVVVDCLVRDPKLHGHLLRRASVGDQLEDFDLAIGQRIVVRR